jgi:hypothetical protein
MTEVEVSGSTERSRNLTDESVVMSTETGELEHGTLSSRPEDHVPERPGDGLTLVRSGSDADLLKARTESSARLARNIVLTLGVVTAGAGIADGVLSRTPLAWAIATFGIVLAALSAVQTYLLRRDQRNRVEAVHLWDEGVELVLANGEIRGGNWGDADFGLQLVARRARPPVARQYLMIWLPDSKIPPVEITEDAFNRLARSAVDKGLQVSMTRRGPREGGSQMIHVRNRPSPSLEPKSRSARKSAKSDRE